jgi:Lon protease-like protein/ActR/RegA family two-component response regulator
MLFSKGFLPAEISAIPHRRRRLMATRRNFIRVISAAGAALFIRGPVPASAEEEVEVKKLPVMPLRDLVVFPYMMTPFVVGRESSVRALKEALAADKKIFLATQHDAGADEPRPNEIYQVGTVVNIVQSLKLPDGNIKVVVAGIERGKILQISETEGFLQATSRLPRYGTKTNSQNESDMQRVTSMFEQYVKLCQLNYETMIAVVRMEDPAKLTDTIAANLQLSIEEKQGLLEIFDPAERLSRIGDVLDIEIEKLQSAMIEGRTRQSHSPVIEVPAMHGIAVTLLTEDKERLMVLQQRLESTQMGRNVFWHVGFPASPTDAILRQIQDVHADVVLVDIDPQNIQRAMHAIKLIHSNTSEIVIFAVGPMTIGTIVSAMRAGAREYMQRNATPESMVDAFTRFHRKNTSESGLKL